MLSFTTKYTCTWHYVSPLCPPPHLDVTDLIKMCRAGFSFKFFWVSNSCILCWFHGFKGIFLWKILTIGPSCFITSSSFLYNIKNISMGLWYNICSIISECSTMNCSVICSPSTMYLSLLLHISTCILAICVLLHLSFLGITSFSSIFMPITYLSIQPSSYPAIQPSVHPSIHLLNTEPYIIVVGVG